MIFVPHVNVVVTRPSNLYNDLSFVFDFLKDVVDDYSLQSAACGFDWEAPCEAACW